MNLQEMNKSKKIALIVIVLLAFLLRFIQLGDLPPAPTWDEVSWGYNAYSLGIDGKDEFGKSIPIQYLESFGDFKPPVYAYLDLIPVKVFGLTEFATRFPSALAGVLTVFLTYFLVKKIFPEKNALKLFGVSFDLGIITSFILAISPWHILLSRAAFEANVATLFIVLGVYLFLYALEKKNWYVILSVFSFVLAAYTFNSARIVAPVLLGLLYIAHYKFFLKRKKIFLISIFWGLIISLPLLLFLRSPQAKLRYNEVNIFSDVGIIERVNKQHENNENAAWSRIIQNRRFAYSAEYIKHYFDNLSPSFLFIKGDGNPKFSTQDVGQMYLWEIPLFVIGILYLFRKKVGKWWIVPIWIIVGIAPAATARETPHALRIASTLPMFQLITAYGIIQLSQIFKSSKFKKFITIFFSVLIVSVVINFLYFLHNYFFHYSREFSGEWQYGYKEVITYTESVKTRYDSIYFTEQLGRPYMYVLFYGKYSPDYFRNNSVIEREALGFVNVKKLGKYIFDKYPSSLAAKSEGRFLIVDLPGNVPEKSKILKEIKLINNNTTLVVYEK